MRISSLYRYPVKGLSPERVAGALLVRDGYFPGDRLFAVENGPSGFDPANPEHQPKIKYLMLMRNESLARLATHFDESSHVLTIRLDGREAVSGDLRTAPGRGAIEAFFAEYCRDELRGPPKILSGLDHSFSDVAAKVVSIINLASVAAVEHAIGAPVHPLRFRGNLYVAGWPAWREFELMGREISVGAARLKITKRIVRCAATDVDPDTGMRDLTIPRSLMHSFGHMDCGVYARVVKDGEIAPGDAIAED